MWYWKLFRGFFDLFSYAPDQNGAFRSDGHGVAAQTGPEHPHDTLPARGALTPWQGYRILFADDRPIARAAGGEAPQPGAGGRRGSWLRGADSPLDFCRARRSAGRGHAARPYPCARRPARPLWFSDRAREAAFRVAAFGLRSRPLAGAQDSFRMSVEDIIPAVRKGDFVQLTRIPGVGRKTAERIVVELRDKLTAA